MHLKTQRQSKPCSHFIWPDANSWRLKVPNIFKMYDIYDLLIQNKNFVKMLEFAQPLRPHLKRIVPVRTATSLRSHILQPLFVTALQSACGVLISQRKTNLLFEAVVEYIFHVLHVCDVGQNSSPKISPQRHRGNVCVGGSAIVIWVKTRVALLLLRSR